MAHICTITTADYYWKVLALRDSLLHHEPQSHLHVLCIEAFPSFPSEGITHYEIHQLSGEEFTPLPTSRYAGDELRWSLKPVFMSFLLKQGKQKIMYVDNDIYFTGAFHFLYDELELGNMLLTPHDYPDNPLENPVRFEANFRIGLYNAGFVAASASAIPWLNWWASCCTWRCEKSAFRGLYDDQKYLDLLPVLNPDVRIVRHPGCNVAEWNRSRRPRMRQNNITKVGHTPSEVIFIHFNRTTLNAMLTGEDAELLPYFEEYFNVLKKYRPGLQKQSLYSPDPLMHRIKRWIRSIFGK